MHSSPTGAPAACTDTVFLCKRQLRLSHHNRDFHGGSGEGKEGLARSISNLSAEEMQLSQGAAAKRKGRFQIVDDPDAKGRVSRSGSEASFAGRGREGSMPSPTSPAVTLLLPALKVTTGLLHRA